ncbi:hypothetical protein [Nocardia transvalensis]|uniref:HalD/BesD family halogenase n=1 Tax=Nocardia transvalensis TaxID=37333 RepID=UPI001895D234|nr:hypothetical protein [Nocardia transvalensis]MBF6331474.1 hypothetical protein [Nocardia transvalensis]
MTMTTTRLLAMLADRHIDADLVDRARGVFADIGFVTVGFLMPDMLTAQVRAEAEALIAKHGIRRELTFAETDHTPRRMHNVRRSDIHRRLGRTSASSRGRVFQLGRASVW